MGRRTTHLPEEDSPRRLSSSRAINLNRGDVLLGISEYSEDDQRDLLWLYGYAQDKLGGDRERLVKAVGQFRDIVYTTLWKIWAGKYEADIGNVMTAIRQLRDRIATVGDSDFVETVITRAIWGACDYVRKSGEILLLTGPTGRSKTEALIRYQEANNHGATIYVEVPPTNGVSGLMRALAPKFRLSNKSNMAELERGIHAGLNASNLLIVDEAERAFGKSVRQLEFLRSLHDTRGCSIVLCGTRWVNNHFETGHAAEQLEQFVGRCGITLDIPNEASRTECREICEAFNPTPPADMIDAAKNLANRGMQPNCPKEYRGRVRLLFKMLRQAKIIAGDDPVTLSHMRQAMAIRKNLGVFPED